MQRIPGFSMVWQCNRVLFGLYLGSLAGQNWPVDPKQLARVAEVMGLSLLLCPVYKPTNCIGYTRGSELSLVQTGHGGRIYECVITMQHSGSFLYITLVQDADSGNLLVAVLSFLNLDFKNIHVIEEEVFLLQNLHKRSCPN